MPLIKNTAFTAFAFAMYDGNGAPKTGLTVTAQRSLAGAAFAATANSPTELANGFYLITLAAADLNADVVALRFTAPGADPTLITVFPGGEIVDLNAKSSSDNFGIDIDNVGTDLVFGGANAVVFIPFVVYRSFAAQRMAVRNGGVASGNTRMGIYDRAAVLLASTAATAMSGASVVQIIDLSAAVTLGPGLYFMAISNSGTTGQYTYHGLGTASDLIGLRGATSGGIVTSPTIVDFSTSIHQVGRLVSMAVFDYTSSQLAAP